jgi:hypothetical protein
LAWVVLWMAALWTDTWCGFALAGVAAMTGEVTRAAAGSRIASAAIRRLNEVITSVCSGGGLREGAQ